MQFAAHVAYICRVLTALNRPLQRCASALSQGQLFLMLVDHIFIIQGRKCPLCTSGRSTNVGAVMLARLALRELLLLPGPRQHLQHFTLKQTFVRESFSHLNICFIILELGEVCFNFKVFFKWYSCLFNLFWIYFLAFLKLTSSYLGFTFTFLCHLFI